MIITQLIGGLGNQMFQYAAGRSLAAHHNTELKLDITQFTKIKVIFPRQYCLSNFRIMETFATEKELQYFNRHSSHVNFFYSSLYCALTGNPNLFLKKEPCFQFDPDFFALPDNVYLEGYWQSEKYFKNIENIIRSEFTLKENPDQSNLFMAEKILKSNAISIHIRRGDYVTDPVTFDHHGICSLEYYHRSIDNVVEKISEPHFYIFSDDPGWVKQNLHINYAHTYVTHNLGSKDYLDLWLMSQCKHHIIANSSFSWWGAWLGTNPGKMVIAPKQWFNKSTNNTRDLIPDSWYKI
jgi:hypothetical protein